MNSFINTLNMLNILNMLNTLNNINPLKMKHLVLCLTALLFTISTLQAQSKKALTTLLNRDLELYKRYTLALNLDSSLQFMPPKMFEVIPHDSLKATMIEAMDNEYMTVQMTSLDFEPIKKMLFEAIIPKDVLKAIDRKH